MNIYTLIYCFRMGESVKFYHGNLCIIPKGLGIDKEYLQVYNTCNYEN